MQRTFTDAQRSEMLASMRALAADFESTNPPRPAADGRRWSDVGAALADACSDNFMAIITGTSTDDEVRACLITLDDRPGEIVISRRPAPDIYEASVNIGRMARDTEREEALLASFDEYLLAYGKKRKFE